MYASSAFIWGELQKLNTLRRLCCATAVPIEPVDAPITADGLRANEFVPHGRLAQSIAFFRAAGDRAVVLGRDEEHGVDGRDRVLERAAGGGIVGVVVVAVERQVPDRDLRATASLGGREARQALARASG